MNPIMTPYILVFPHWRHEPILVPHIILTKSSTYVKIAIKFVTYTNDIAKLKFAKDYVENNNQLCEGLKWVHVSGANVLSSFKNMNGSFWGSPKPMAGGAIQPANPCPLHTGIHMGGSLDPGWCSGDNYYSWKFSKNKDLWQMSNTFHSSDCRDSVTYESAKGSCSSRSHPLVRNWLNQNHRRVQFQLDLC